MKQAVIGALLWVLPVERPPVEYQTVPDQPAIVLFADPQVVHQVCGELAGVDPYDLRKILACANPRNRTILLPSPCLYEDGYAKLVCHEVAHLNAWKH